MTQNGRPTHAEVRPDFSYKFVRGTASIKEVI
jgi:hypothetical protein